MDKLKDFLRLLIGNRFWILVGISALLPAIAYALGSTPVKEQAKTQAQNIENANKSAQQYASGVVPNGQYKSLVLEKNEELSKDVLTSWKKLYERQAPLLKWPEIVAEQFRKWGRAWPTAEQADASSVTFARINYVTEYPKAVTEVYKSFDPYDPITGKGNVIAQPEPVLLRPAQFSEDTPPSLGKIWDAQERLWIQASMLDVVAKLNKDAKDWDSAIVKQIILFEVGNFDAQDQRSMAKGDLLEEAPELTPPLGEGEEAPVEDEFDSGMMTGAMGMRNSMMGQDKAEAVFYVKSADGTSSPQFRTVPVMMSVLVDLKDIPDFLVAFENSPMAIQVMDFEMAKPSVRVTKPLQGEDFKLAMEQGLYGNMGGMSGQGMRGNMMGGARRNRMTGFGGMMYGGGMMGGMSNREDDSPMLGMRGMRSGMGGMGRPMAPQGKDMRGVNRAEERKEREELEKLTKPMNSIHDPYYNIVEVTVYGQARFYNPPPDESAPAESNAEGGAPPDGAPEAEANPKAEPASAPPAGEGTSDINPATTPPAETPKGEVPKDEASKDTATPEAGAPSEPPVQPQAGGDKAAPPP